MQTLQCPMISDRLCVEFHTPHGARNSTQNLTEVDRGCGALDVPKLVSPETVARASGGSDGLTWRKSRHSRRRERGISRGPGLTPGRRRHFHSPCRRCPTRPFSAYRPAARFFETVGNDHGSARTSAGARRAGARLLDLEAMPRCRGNGAGIAKSPAPAFGVTFETFETGRNGRRRGLSPPALLIRSGCGPSHHRCGVRQGSWRTAGCRCRQRPGPAATIRRPGTAC